METRAPQESTERVTVYLVNEQTVVGNMHVPRHSRLLDMLNHQSDVRPFFALTDVEWHSSGAIARHEFVCIHRSHVVAVHPVK